LSGAALDLAAMNELRNNILTANHERERVKYTADPYVVKAVEQQYDLQKEAVKHSYNMQEIAAHGA